MQSKQKNFRTHTALLAIGQACCAAALNVMAAPAELPDAVKVEAGAKPLLVTKATGAQVYVCEKNAAGNDAYGWKLKAPEASILNEAGVPIGRHYAGPTWQMLDGSKAVGEIIGRAPGADKQDIPWLLLKVKEASGSGVISKAAYVQRLYTEGGVAPATGCSDKTSGEEYRSYYRATYVFFAQAPASTNAGASPTGY